MSNYKIRIKMKCICFCTHLQKENESAKRAQKKNEDAKKKRKKFFQTHIFKNEDAKQKQRRRFYENDVNLAVASTVSQSLSYNVTLLFTKLRIVCCTHISRGSLSITINISAVYNLQVFLLVVSSYRCFFFASSFFTF